MNMYTIRHDCQIKGLAEIYNGFFGYKTDGTFVEVGANDGISYSNTYFLAAIGWKGVYIEPVPELYEKCVENHKSHLSVLVLKEFVSDDEKPVELFCRYDINTADEGFIQKAGLRVPGARVLTVNPVLLHDILWSESIKPGFDLLVVDVEGYELHVLKSVEIDYWQPLMVIIETHAMSSDPVMNVRDRQITWHLQSFGYIRIYADAINSIFVYNDV